MIATKDALKAAAVETIARFAHEHAPTLVAFMNETCRSSGCLRG